MIQSKTIIAALPNTLETIDLPELGKKYQGKVRDFYILKDRSDDKAGRRVTITTDRQSAFDIILGQIPFKGAVLNQLAAFWFEKTKNIVSNHMLSMPDPNVLVSKNCQPIPVEMVVRGYLSGVTKTSIWYSYEKGERKIYGMSFPDGMKKNQKLPTPVITPTTHPEAGSNLHDERLTRDEIIKRKIVEEKLYEHMENVALKLFAFGQKWCETHGLILVDTKYEFGLYNGELTLIDEIHTPDSSRFWITETYEKKLASGEEPENFDKEFLRLWYAKRGYTGDGKPLKMTEELAIELSKRYIKTYEMLTEKEFNPFSYPIEDRIKQNLKKSGIL
jgi:phosphoribosylaminoimidazole-succinocarboxamide synthase